MKTMERLEILFKAEAANIVEHETVAADTMSLDLDLHLRYKKLLGQYKHMMTLVGDMIEDINSQEFRRYNNAAVIEQRYYDLQKQNQELYKMCCFDALTGL